MKAVWSFRVLVRLFSRKPAICAALLAAIASMLFTPCAFCQEPSTSPPLTSDGISDAALKLERLRAMLQEKEVDGIARDSAAPAPDRIITFGPNSRLSAFQSRHQGHTGFVSVRREAINIWSALTYYWPESAIVVFMLTGSIWLWRLLRRRRIPGEPYCRRCNYRLTGVATEKCPECGAALEDRGRVIGKRIRFKLTAAILIMLAVPIPVLCGIWFQVLPRQAAFSDWVDWWSISLHEYAKKHNLQWLAGHTQNVRMILEVDVATGETLRLVHAGSLGGSSPNLLIDSDGSSLFTVSYTSDSSTPEALRVQVVQIDTASGRVRRLIPIEQPGLQLELVGYADDTQTLHTLSREQEQLRTLSCSTGEVAQLAKINYHRQTLGSGGTSFKSPIVLTVPPLNQRIVVAENDGQARMRVAPNYFYTRHTYKVTLWDAPARYAVAGLGESMPIGAMAASGDGKRLYAAVYGKGIQVWNLQRPEQAPWIVTEDGPARNLDEITISPDGRYLFGVQSGPRASRSESIHVFDLLLLAWVDERAVPAGSHVMTLSVSGDGEFLVAESFLQNGFRRQLAVYDLEKLAMAAKVPASEGITASPPDVGAIDDSGRTPLHAAAETGDLALAKILIANGADVNARSDTGVTPLHLGMEHGRWTVAELLVRKGANIKAVTDDGMTAPELARRRPDLDDASLNIIESLEREAQAGSLSYAPTEQLIHRLAAGGTSEEVVANELLKRIGMDQLEETNYSLFFDLCVAGDDSAPPLSDQWKRKYGRILKEALRGSFSMSPFGGDKMGEAKKKLYDLPLEVTLRSRDQWPTGVPLVIQATMQEWWPFPTGHRVYATPRLPDAETTVLTGGASPIMLPMTEAIDTDITFDLRIDQLRQSEPDAQWTTVEQRTVTIPVRIAGTIDDVLTPVESEKMDRILEDNLTYEVGDGWLSFMQNSPTEILLFNGVAIGVVMEFVLDGEVVATELHWWLGGADPPPHDRQWGWTKKSPWSAQPDEDWTIRIYSDPEVALRVIDADRYWSGEITIPLTVRDW